MKNLTWQNPEQLFVAQELINKVKSKCCGIKDKIKITVEDEIIAAEEQAEVSQKVDEILSILTERQREIIYLRYMQECSYEEIAEIMQISVPACRKLLYRTLLKLKHNNTLVLFYLLLSINVG